MRVRVVGTGPYANINAEYDVLLSTPVMNLKVRIMNQFSIQPSEQQFTYKGMELKNMECVLNCGIKNGEQIVLAPSQHLITVTMHYGKEQIKTDVKPTATFLGLKNLLYTKTQQTVNINTVVAVFEDGLMKDTTMISSYPTIGSKPVYFTYPEYSFQVHFMENSTSSITKPFSSTVGELRTTISDIAHEDPSLLVLESEGDLFDYDDNTPLYQTALLESNSIQVTFLSIAELIRRVRTLERREKQQETSQHQRQQLVEKCSSITKHNDVMLKQLKTMMEANAIKQEQKVDNLMGTLKLMKAQIANITPHFEEIDKLRSTNKELQQRVEAITKSHSRDSLSSETESALEAMQKRVSELEKRIDHLTVSRRVVPPSLPVSETPKILVENSNEQAEEEKQAMPNLRKAFASPKFPSFILKAIRNRGKSAVDSIVCTLPPYAKM